MAYGTLPGAVELVRSLHGTVAMGCLSNTNAIHWEHHRQHWGLVEYFDWTFVSHELGMMKPDHEIYKHSIATVGVDADRILFLDDSLANVSAARSLGIRAEHTVGIDQLKRALAQHLGA